MSRKFSQGKVSGRVLPLVGGRASSCCRTSSPLFLAMRNHGWMDRLLIFPAVGEITEQRPLQPVNKCCMLYSPWSALYQLCQHWLEHWNAGIAPNSPKNVSPSSRTPFLRCACDLQGPPQQISPPAHICAQKWGKAPFPEACPCAVAS